MDSSELARGIALFNQGKFFDAHEVLEDVWRSAPAEQKKFFQGLVQVAVAFHHHSTGNQVGMRSVLARAIRNLRESQQHKGGIELEALLDACGGCLESLDSGLSVLSLPRIGMVRKNP